MEADPAVLRHGAGHVYVDSVGFAPPNLSEAISMLSRTL